MTPARGYLVFVESVVGNKITRQPDPIGAVWVTTRRDGSSFIDTARAEARRLYHLPGHQRAYVQLRTPIVSAIQKRRDRLSKRHHPDSMEPPVLETYADSWRAVLADRHSRILKRAGLWHTKASPGGVGLL
jgi:hypothetical protein